MIVDTPIWSLALRRRPRDLAAADSARVAAWSDLISRDALILLGPVRQEVLSGISDRRTFERLRLHLRAFEDEPLMLEDFEEAARCGNHCRTAGLTGLEP